MSDTAAHPLTYLRQSYGWGPVEFARLLNELAAVRKLNIACNRSTVWKWEHGQIPDEPTQALIADLIGLADHQWRYEEWPLWLPVWEVPGLRASWDTPGTVDALAHLNGSGLMDRRGFVTITGAALVALAASWADAPSAFASALDGDRVTDAMVTTIEQRVDTLRSLDDQMGGARLLEQARGDLSLITGLLQGGRYTEQVGGRLHAVAARVCYLTGWMAFDTGLHSAGQQYYVGALRASRTAGDGAFGAFILAEMGIHVAEAGHPRDRVHLITTAIDNAPKSLAPAVGSFLHVHQAVALAGEGRHERAGASFTRAVTLWDRHRTTGEDRPDWLGWYGPAQLASSEGKLLLASGQYDKATASLEDSVNQAVPRDAAVRSARLAEARLLGKDLDGALDAANQGAALLESRVSSARATSRLHEFSAKLNPYQREARVTEFRDRLSALPTPA